MTSSAAIGRDMLQHYLGPLRPFLDDAEGRGITEVCVNRPGEVWTEGFDGWARHSVPVLTFEHCRQLAKLIASSNGTTIREDQPILSAKLPTKERVQIVMPPACTENTVSITIRKPSNVDFSLAELEEQGSFESVKNAATGLQPFEHELLKLRDEKRYREFLELAVKSHRNIIIGGATGSGKTTITKSLIRCIPHSERVITIEDVHELFMENFPNKVHLFFRNDPDSKFKSQDALASCVRMKPDRILLAELRGPETLDFIDSLNTGHPGSISTVHANSALDVFNRLTSLIKKNPTGLTLDADYIRAMCLETIDVVLFYERRKLKEIYYDPERKYSRMG